MMPAGNAQTWWQAVGSLQPAVTVEPVLVQQVAKALSAVSAQLGPQVGFSPPSGAFSSSTVLLLAWNQSAMLRWRVALLPGNPARRVQICPAALLAECAVVDQGWGQHPPAE